MQSLKQQSKVYAGIGSRETPRPVLLYMTEIAKRLAKLGYTCNSGGAPGADSAFEKGARINRQVYLPWDGFNGKVAENMNKLHDTWNYSIPPFNGELVKKYHPKPTALSDSGWKLMSRNSYQVLGPDLQSPVEFVLCWTKDGKASGGTGQALRIAKAYNIQVFNFFRGYEEFANYMKRTILFA